MKSIRKKLLVTSPIDPEIIREICFEKWGASEAHLLKPFQAKEMLSGSGRKPHLKGITKGRLKRFLKVPCAIENHFWFYPNDIATCLHRPKGFSYSVRKSIDRYNEHEGKKYKESLANLYFCFVDFDPPKGVPDEQRIAARNGFLNQVKGFALPPDVIVDSGNGIHAYWSIRPIHVLREYYEEEHPALEKFGKVQKALASYFGCDSIVATSKPRVMRIPNTWNVKSGVKRMCQYIKGDLTLARISPVYTLDQLYSFLWQEKIIDRSKTPRKKRRPRPQFDGWREALLTVQGHFGLGKLSEQFKTSFKFYYGHLKLGYVLEGARNREILGTNGRAIKTARDRFVALGLIRIESKADYKNKKAMKITFTDLFYRLCKVEMKCQGDSVERRQRIIDEVVRSECPAGERRKLLPVRLNKLVRQGGIRDLGLLREILSEWIENRPAGLPRDTGEIDYLLETNIYLNKDQDDGQGE